MAFFSNPFATLDDPPTFLAPSALLSSSPTMSTRRRSSLARASLTCGTLDIGPLDGPGVPYKSSSAAREGSSGTFTFPAVSSSGSPSRSGESRSSFTATPTSRSSSRQGHDESRRRAPSPGPSIPTPRRSSLQTSTSNLTPLWSPPLLIAPFLSANPPTVSATSAQAHIISNSLSSALSTSPQAVVDFSRRRSVDVGVLGLGSHHQFASGGRSKRMREAVGPDAGDKETGFIGSELKGGKDRLLGQHLASILAHSLALCSDSSPYLGPIEAPLSPPYDSAALLPTTPLAVIPASPADSPYTSSHPSRRSSRGKEVTTAQELAAKALELESPESPSFGLNAFPSTSENKRFKLIGQLQSWTFNAMEYTSDELLSLVGLMFESVRNMEGVEFDLDRLKALLLSLRSAYHTRNGYHNFSHAIDVTQACYSFLVRMGLAPPLYLLCEDDYDPNSGEGKRKWRRNRAVREGGMGELMRPMDVFALMVAAIGHDVGHPGLSNAYMVNAHAPVAQVYNDQSVLENFHTITLIHMLRHHNFDYLLGGDFGHLGENATSFRKILEGSILATDMSRHFGFVNQLVELGKKFEFEGPGRGDKLEEDRLLFCAGLIKCGDISNPTRPHRISRAWSTALLNEWNIQAAIEVEFGLPISVMTLDPLDGKAQAKSQVGFIDLFAKPLFTAMAGVVDEFADFAEKLRDGRAAWQAIAVITDTAFSQPISPVWKLADAPTGRNFRTSPSSDKSPPSKSTLSPLSTSPPHAAPIPIALARGRAHRGGFFTRHVRRNSDESTTSSSLASPISPYLTGSNSSNTSGLSSFPMDLSSGLSSPMSYSPTRHGSNIQSTDPFHLFGCGGVCKTFTATCETCSRRNPGPRRGSLGAWVGFGSKKRDGEDEDGRERGREEGEGEWEEDKGAWPPYPFQPA